MNNKRIRKHLISSVDYWQPHVPYFSPIKKTITTSLKVAAIVGNRLFQGLRYDCSLLLLTEHNWNETIIYGEPDILLIESCFVSATGHWHLAQNNSSKIPADFIDLLRLAEQNNIPSVFWITQDVQYLELYKQVASYFDYVFCADPRSVKELNNVGIKSTILPPAVQPAIYNPFREYEFAQRDSLNVLYDGMYDLEQYSEQFSLLKDVKKYGLSIIESRHQLIEERSSVPEEFKENILGCVTFDSRLVALRYASTCLMMSNSTSSSITQQWQALECAACRIPVLHLGQLADNDVRKNIVFESENDIDILTELYRFGEDELYREKIAHLAWRKVYSQHTFTHRIQSICQTVGVSLTTTVDPLVSIILASNREQYLEKCIKTFNDQVYKNKEMIIVYNGPVLSSPTKAKIEEMGDKIRLISAPSEISIGLAINIGVTNADGTYCLKMDDDDLYSEYYVYDMLLYSKAIDFDIFGKSQSRFTYYESDDSYWYTNKKNRIPLCVVPYEHPDYSQKMFVSGNSIGATTKLMKEYPWTNNIPKGSDNVFLFSIDRPVTIVTTDIFNMAVVRRKDISTHTWQISEEKLKDNSIKIPSEKNFPCFIV